MADLVLDWGLFGAFGSVINGTNTVDAGGVEVTVDVTAEDEGATGVTFNGAGFVADSETFNPFSGLKLFGQGGEGGVDNTSTTTISFASADPMFVDEVQNVAFRINDIDAGLYADVEGGAAPDAFEDIVTVRAYDANDAPVPVTFALGANTSEAGGTLTGTGDAALTDADNSVLVTVDGPVARIEIDYDNGNLGEQGVMVSDIQFSTVEAPEGDDDEVITPPVDTGNTAPIADADFATTEEEVTVQIFALGNDFDADGDTLTITSATSADGTVVVDGGTPNSVFFTPNPGFVGEASIAYTIDDGNGGTDTSTISITVTENNAAPVANDDTAQTAVNTPVILAPLVNDSDPDGDTITIASATSTDGSIVDNGDGTLTFTPNDGLVGPASISYTIEDGSGASASATITVDVTVGPRIDADVFPVDPSVDPLDGLDQDPDPTNDLDDETGTAGADTISTGDDADTIRGGQGDDLLEGGIDNDSVLGGQGNDTIIDEQGADFIDGGQGDDSIVAGIDTFLDDTDVDNPILTAAGLDVDGNTDDGRDSVLGATGNDTILTGDDSDTIDGGQDDDLIDAGIDDDVVAGATGNDTIIGGHGNDTIDGGQGDDSIDAGIETTSSLITNGIDLTQTDDVDINDNNDRDVVDGGAGDDTITTGDDDDSILGGSGNDLIKAGIDDDTVDGGDGDDSIDGGEGDDSLMGGEGCDVFFNVNAGDCIDGGEGGKDIDVLDLTGSKPDGGRLEIVYTSEDREDGVVNYFNADGSDAGQLKFTEIENIIPCFTPGTVIATPLGERMVEDLREGDRIITRDNGLQEIRWIGKREMTGHELARNPHLRPILIQAGALGENMPEHDILVSPNHRMLVTNDKTSLYFEESEVLVAAKHLTGLDGVDEVGTLGVTYMHFLFDRHEVVLANGAWSESFQPGDYTLKGMGNAQRNEIFELFPELGSNEGVKDYAAARRSLKKHEAELLVK